MNRRDHVMNRTSAASAPPGGRISATAPGCRPGSGTKVLAERNQAVAAVGAWVEDGHELQQHPFVLALLTEEQQLEVRRQREQRLVQFQQDVRRRVQQAQALKRRRQLQKTSQQQAEYESRFPHRPQDSYQHYSPAKHQSLSSQQGALDTGSLHADRVEGLGLARGHEQHRAAEQHSQQVRCLCKNPSKGMRHVRRRLAKCQILTDGEMISELPGGVWHVSPTRDKPISKTLRAEEETNEEEEDLNSEAEEEDVPLTGGHVCPLVRQSVYVHAGGRKSVTFDTDPVTEQVFRDHHGTGPADGSRTSTRVPQVLWPLDDPQEIKRQHHQSRLVRHRRLYMDMEREQVKEHRRQSKHLKRIARIKAEHEQLRQEEERNLDNLEKQRAARLRMEERELLILQRLRLEEEQRTVNVEKMRKPEDKDRTRFVEAFRARLKERLPQEKVWDLPPLCCCGDAFWDAHPDTCANNCVFYNNPKAYVKALQSAVFSLDLLEGSTAPHWIPTH